MVVYAKIQQARDEIGTNFCINLDNNINNEFCCFVSISLQTTYSIILFTTHSLNTNLTHLVYVCWPWILKDYISPLHQNTKLSEVPWDFLKTMGDLHRLHHQCSHLEAHPVFYVYFQSSKNVTYHAVMENYIYMNNLNDINCKTIRTMLNISGILIPFPDLVSQYWQGIDMYVLQEYIGK